MLYSDIISIYVALMSYHLFVLIVKSRQGVEQSFGDIERTLNVRANESADQILLKKARKDECLKSLPSTPRHRVNVCGLQKLQHFLGLPLDPYSIPKPKAPPRRSSNYDPDILDVIFVAIDFKYIQKCRRHEGTQVKEVGISTLDTRILLQQYGCIEARGLISTWNYRIEQHGVPFRFGETPDVSEKELFNILKRLFYMDNDLNDEVRNIILIGHNTGVKVRILNALGIDLTLAPSVVELLDTEYLFKEMFSGARNYKLGDVVEKVGISSHLDYFQNAGNDANFTLRAMFLLAIYRYNPVILDRNQKLTLAMYKKIAKH